MQIKAEIVETFQTEGVVRLEGAFGDWIGRLAEGVAELRRRPSALERSYRPADGSAPFFQDFCNWQRIEAFRAFVLDSPAAELAAQLMRSDRARFFHDHVLVKEPGSSVVTPWHQDEPYYCVAGAQSVSFWTPLDPVSRAVSLECIAGSHRWSRTGFRPLRFDGSPLFPDDDFELLPDLEARREELPIRGWALAPGDAVAFHFRTVHGAAANDSPAERRVFSHRWVGDDARFVRRGARGSPPFPHLALEDGAPFDAPEFPVVYRR
ncbi:MAG TPA: phytanoyl-CoA dioxygenase family protein [Steroidobacteraceae bacterium]|nr:phytanoyl-CoA dioxygenase family protein [Steroidobacteraceae bacterium]